MLFSICILALTISEMPSVSHYEACLTSVSSRVSAARRSHQNSSLWAVAKFQGLPYFCFNLSEPRFGAHMRVFAADHFCNGSPNGIDESLRWQICHQTKLEAEASCRNRVNVNHLPSLMFFNFLQIFFNILIFISFKNLQDAYIFDFALEKLRFHHYGSRGRWVGEVPKTRYARVSDISGNIIR